MSREFATKLAERIASMFVFAFLATYAAGSVGVAFHTTTPLSVAQRSLIAGIAAATQMLLGVTVAPFVGNPNSPSLLPKFVLRKLGTPVPTGTPLVVSLEDVVQATLKQVAAKHPDAADVTAEDVVHEVLAAKKVVTTAAAAAAEKPQPPQPPQPASSEGPDIP